MTNPKYRPHQMVERLTAATGEAGAVRLLGYFGSTADGVVKVYPSLDDLSVYYEIREDDIVNVEEASADALPHGGSEIWVKATARVERCVSQRVSTEARFLAGGIAGDMAKGPAVSYRAAAPLALEPETARGPACEYSKVWPCSVVVGVCLASNDMPCAYTEQWWCPGEVATAASCFTCAGYTCVAECYSAGCPPTQRYCTGGLITRCGCEVYSAVRCR